MHAYCDNWCSPHNVLKTRWGDYSYKKSVVTAFFHHITYTFGGMTADIVRLVLIELNLILVIYSIAEEICVSVPANPLQIVRL